MPRSPACKQSFRSTFVIIGGGIIGSAAAYFLARRGAAADTIVIEPDPSYERASTPAGAGGVRRLMSRPENILMSQFSLEFYSNISKELETDVDIGFKRQGYLFLEDSTGAADLELNFKTQERLGVDARLLDAASLTRLFPSIGSKQVALACFSPNDAWIDPHLALAALRGRAQQLGVRYVKDSVVALPTRGDAVTEALLGSGARVHGNIFLNTAGAWVSEIARMTDAKLPVYPMCRVQHYWVAADEIEPLPLVKNGTGLFFRPEGQGFVGGCPSFEIERGFIWNINEGYFADYFEQTVWPLLADAVPKFDQLKFQRQWGGHYAQNVFDGNMIIGRYDPGYKNILTACGFSGHGIMHAPAVGRALAELCIDGDYQSIDLSPMEFFRVTAGTPYPEIGIR